MKLKTLLQVVFYCVTGCLLSIGSLKAQTPDFPGSPASWSIVASYSIPGKASGLAWDGTYIYFGIYGSDGDKIYRFSPSSGTNTQLCSGPFGDAYGLTYKTPNLVTINQPSSSSQPSTALEFTMAGALVSNLTLPNHYMSGIAYDNGSYWVCTYYPDPGTVYHINSSGTVLSQFTPPANQPWDICMHGSNLWIADYNANMLYKVSSTGTVLESHASQGSKPSGIVYEGTYLWYCDGPLGGGSTLYKVDLLGAGTPAINIPVTSHDYGTVAIGSSASWNCQVQNTGTANLSITSIDILTGDPISTTLTLPATITPGGSINVPLIYQPVTAGPLNTSININSNDPIHPSVTVTLTGNAVFTGPHLNIQQISHDWGQRRMGSYSRWYLPVTNDGTQNLVISSLSIDDPHFIIDQNLVLPISLIPLQTSLIGIWFHPEAGDLYSGILNIGSNDPTQNPFPVNLTGLGVDTQYPLGTPLWSYLITTGFDNSPKAIHPIGDITGDGVDDVIICSEDNYVRCLNGNSSGEADVMWATEIYSGNVYTQNALSVIQDINNDGYEDVVIGTTGGDRSIRILSGKTGSPLWRYDTHAIGDGGWVYQVDNKYDYNNDGVNDVLGCAGDDGNGTGPRCVFCLNGLTGLPLWICPTGGPVFSVIGVDDFTNDGKPDVIAGASNANETQSKVYGINGATGSILWTSYPQGTSVWALIQIDDVTGDGIRDVASGDYEGLVHFHNAVSGNQVSTCVVQNNTLLLRFEDVGDVNKDTHPDFIVGFSGAKGVIVDGYTNALIWQQPLSDKSWNVTNMGDITFDGYNDVCIGTLYQDNRVYFLNGPNGEILKETGSSTPIDALDAIPDIVGDSTMEAVIGGRNGAVYCLSGGYDSTIISVKPGVAGLLQKIKVFPNPCPDKLNIAYRLQQASTVTIEITDITGKVLYSRILEEKKPGTHIMTVDRNQIFGNLETETVCILKFGSSETTERVKVVFQ